MRPTRPLPLGLALLLLVAACATGTGDDLEAVAPGKADDYYSDVAAEFEVTGRVPVEMTATEYADEARREEIVGRRLTAVGLYLTTYVTDKFRGSDVNGDGKISDDEIFFENEGYGGFHAMVRNQSTETLEVDSVNGGYVVTFTIDMAGPANLLSRLPKAPGGQPADGVAFLLRLPAGATIDPADVDSSDAIRTFDADTYTGELESLRLVARKLPRVGNAYPRLAEMMADGELDVTLFYGYDYNTPRGDLLEAEEAFATLVRLGFDAPVARFEDLARDSGPFVRTMTAAGREVTVEVRIFHADLFLGAPKTHHDRLLQEITRRDVFFYNGHAGPYYGFYLDAKDEAFVDYGELATAPFTDRQQLVVAQGCQTYSQYADMIYAHPAKDESNLDVITTVNYSYGVGTVELLENLLDTDDGAHVLVDYYRLIADLNAVEINREGRVMYGVMGISENPHLHPYAALERVGESCRSASACGDVSGNVCVAPPGGASKECAAVSLSSDGCPDGTRYYQLASGGTITSGACFADR